MLIALGNKKDEEQDSRLSKIDEANAQQDALIALGTVKDEEHDARLSEIDETNSQQDALIALGAVKDKEQDARLCEIDNTNTRQDALISQVNAKNNEQDELLKQQSLVIEDLKSQVETLKMEKGNKIVMYITTAISVTGLILSILHFFI